MGSGQARVLFALARPPVLGVHTAGPLHIAPDLADASAAFQVWRTGIIAERLPIMLNLVSARDPGLAPENGATVTATLGAVPYRLFDGGWTHEKRELLRRRALDAAESISPGFGDRVVAAEVITPVDMEEQLGVTEGDLAGGEIAGDQFFGAPWEQPALPRTPVEGLYLAGSHLAAGAFATCAAGSAAAEALIADHRQGRLK
jgi:phytoene dehydrogenase-like protein